MQKQTYSEHFMYPVP